MGDGCVGGGRAERVDPRRNGRRVLRLVDEGRKEGGRDLGKGTAVAGSSVWRGERRLENGRGGDEEEVGGTRSAPSVDGLARRNVLVAEELGELELERSLDGVGLEAGGAAVAFKGSADGVSENKAQDRCHSARVGGRTEKLEKRRGRVGSQVVRGRRLDVAVWMRDDDGGGRGNEWRRGAEVSECRRCRHVGLFFAKRVGRGDGGNGSDGGCGCVKRSGCGGCGGVVVEVWVVIE